jgi:hypothetical protein
VYLTRLVLRYLNDKKKYVVQCKIQGFYPMVFKQAQGRIAI